MEAEVSWFPSLDSWVMLIVGIAICGKEGWYMTKRLNRKYGNRVIECFKKPKT